ncbi:unnamed protein product [Arctogadus glacialis]
MDPSGKKRKGGAERARDQKKAALQADATKCLKIADMFAARGHGASTSAAAASTGSGGEDARQQVDEAAMTVPMLKECWVLLLRRGRWDSISISPTCWIVCVCVFWSIWSTSSHWFACCM